MATVALRIEAATACGVREGALPLARVCWKYGVPAVFLFALGPDRLGGGLVGQMFRPGFIRQFDRARKVFRHGWGTLLNGVLRPGPHLGRAFGDIMRQVRDKGFEVGLHGYDAERWRWRVGHLSIEAIRGEFNLAVAEFRRVFREKPGTAGAPGWQCHAKTLQVVDEAGLLYASDTRGRAPFMPVVDGREYRTPQFPTTLPALDEVLGRPELTGDRLTGFYLERLGGNGLHVLTVRAELEGRHHLGFFERLITDALARGVTFVSLRTEAQRLAARAFMDVPRDGIELQPLPGGSGRVAMQASAVMARAEADIKSRPPWARKV